MWWLTSAWRRYVSAALPEGARAAALRVWEMWKAATQPSGEAKTGGETSPSDLPTLVKPK